MFYFLLIVNIPRKYVLNTLIVNILWNLNNNNIMIVKDAYIQFVLI